MKALKNYFIIFLLCLAISFAGKTLFAFYNFPEFTASQKWYAIFYGYKFDLAISAAIAFTATVIDFNKRWLVGFSLALILFYFSFLVGDTMYYQDAARHISYEIKDLFAEAEGLIGTAWQDYGHLLMASLVVFALLAYGGTKLLWRSLQAVRFTKSYIPVKLFIIAFTVFCLRGLAQHIPLDPWHAYKIGDAKLAMISLNGGYNALFQNIRNKGDIKITPAYAVINPEKSVQSLYAAPTDPYQGTALNKPNIVMLFLESWSAANFKHYGGAHDIVPEFEQILAKSIRPKAMIAGGHRTVEGVFTTLTSYQNPLGRAVGRTSLQAFHYTSLLDILKAEHYSSAFFQGSNAGTEAGSLAQNLGFTHSYGRWDIKERIYPENHWGVQDPDLYNFVLKKISTMKKPFIIGINGATTHDSVVPDGVKKLHFSDDPAVNDDLNAYHFSDAATGAFIRELSKRDPNTVFVIFADHVGGLKSDSNFLQYLIPFAIYSPKLAPKYIDAFVSQRDIAPTLLDLVSGDYQKLAPAFSGKSLLRDHDFFADYYANGVLGVVKGNTAIESVGKNFTCYAVGDFHPKKETCPANAADTMNAVKAWTNLQQKLLFDGKTQQFGNYRYAAKE